MAAANKKRDREIAEAVLRLAARGWEKMTLEQVAKAAKIPSAVVRKRFAGTDDMLPLLVAYVSGEVFSICEKPGATVPVRECLFDILMARIDVLQRHRKAFLSLAESASRQPKIALKLVPAQLAAMQETLKFVGAGGTKLCNNLPPLGLLAVYLAALHVWRQEETLDMSKTMAVLDRYLRYAARAAILFRSDFMRSL